MALCWNGNRVSSTRFRFFHRAQVHKEQYRPIPWLSFSKDETENVFVHAQRLDPCQSSVKSYTIFEEVRLHPLKRCYISSHCSPQHCPAHIGLRESTTASKITTTLRIDGSMCLNFTGRCMQHGVDRDFVYTGPGEGAEHARAIAIERQA